MQSAVKANWVLVENITIISLSLGCSGDQGSIDQVLSLWSGLRKQAL